MAQLIAPLVRCRAFKAPLISKQNFMRPVAVGAYGGFLILPINMRLVSLQKIEMATHNLLCAYFWHSITVDCGILDVYSHLFIHIIIKS
jgi:hypothetical protein